MVEVYISWCKGLPENKEAMKILRDSEIVDGIETSEYQDIEKIHSEGLKANIHRPFRWQEFNLEDESFPEICDHEIREYSKSDSSVLGFHIVDYKKHNKKSDQEIVENIKRNIDKLDSLFEKDIVFELPPYDSYFFKKRSDSANFLTSKDVVEDLIKNTSSGFLLDISHTYVSGMNKIQEGKFNGTIEDYFREILDVSKDKIWQLHLNVPTIKESECIDNHETFEDNKMSEKIIQILKSILSECKNIKVITLEADTNLSPIEHSKKMVQQIEKLNKRLNIKNKIKISSEYQKII